MLIRPEILAVMMSASKDPEAHREEEKIKRERRMTMAPDELEKIRSEG